MIILYTAAFLFITPLTGSAPVLKRNPKHGRAPQVSPAPKCALTEHNGDNNELRSGGRDGGEEHQYENTEKSARSEDGIRDPKKLERWKKTEGEMYVYCVSMNVTNCPGEGKWRKSEGVVDKPPSSAKWELNLTTAVVYCTAKERKDCEKVKNGEWQEVQSKMTRWVKETGGNLYYCEGLNVEDCPLPLEGWVLQSLHIKGPPRGVYWMDSNGDTKVYCSAEQMDDCVYLGDGAWHPVVIEDKPERWKRTMGKVTFFCDALQINSCPDWYEWFSFDEDTSEPPVHAVWSLSVDEGTKLFCTASKKNTCQSLKKGDWKLVNPEL